MRYLNFWGWHINKNKEKVFHLDVPSGKIKIKTKDPLKTLNKLGYLFHFRPIYLQKAGIINNLDLLQLVSWRKKYGRIKACLLELK